MAPIFPLLFIGDVKSAKFGPHFRPQSPLSSFRFEIDQRIGKHLSWAPSIGLCMSSTNLAKVRSTQLCELSLQICLP